METKEQKKKTGDNLTQKDKESLKAKGRGQDAAGEHQRGGPGAAAPRRDHTDFKARGLPAAAGYFQDDQLAKKIKQASGKTEQGSRSQLHNNWQS